MGTCAAGTRHFRHLAREQEPSSDEPWQSVTYFVSQVGPRGGGIGPEAMRGQARGEPDRPATWDQHRRWRGCSSGKRSSPPNGRKRSEPRQGSWATVRAAETGSEPPRPSGRIARPEYVPSSGGPLSEQSLGAGCHGWRRCWSWGYGPRRQARCAPGTSPPWSSPRNLGQGSAGRMRRGDVRPSRSRSTGAAGSRWTSPRPLPRINKGGEIPRSLNRAGRCIDGLTPHS
jgi:hypothetical protein